MSPFARPTSLKPQSGTLRPSRNSSANQGMKTSANQNPLRSDLSPAGASVSPDRVDQSPDRFDLSRDHSDLSPDRVDLSPDCFDLSPRRTRRNGVSLNKTTTSKTLRARQSGFAQSHGFSQGAESKPQAGRVRFTSLL